jgi:hypothetical protein
MSHTPVTTGAPAVHNSGSSYRELLKKKTFAWELIPSLTKDSQPCGSINEALKAALEKLPDKDRAALQGRITLGST